MYGTGAGCSTVEQKERKIMLRGCDISHHNGNNAVKRIIEQYNNNIDFFIVKLSEGKSYVDPKWDVNAGDVELNHKLLGLYHYARPENNNYNDEAHFFCEYFKRYIGKAIPCLDWEGEALNYSPEWALGWMDTVYNITHVRPVIYVQQSEIRKLECIQRHNYGLWVARWNTTPGTIYPWPYYTMWQYTNSPIDLDYFNGNSAQFLKYCKPVQSVTIPTPDDTLTPTELGDIEVSCNGEVVVTKGDKVLWRGKIILSSAQDKDEN